MKVAVLSESAHDEAAIRVLIDAILNVDTVAPEGQPRLESRGWPSVEDVLPVVIRATYYHSDALGLAVVVDSDNSPLHVDDQTHRGGDPADCRTCRLKVKAATILEGLKNRPAAMPLHIAIAVATPALEAWLHCSRDTSNNEDRWMRELEEHKTLDIRRRELKTKVYAPGKNRLECALSEARRIATDFDKLNTHFAHGFGSFAEQIRRWKQQ